MKEIVISNVVCAIICAKWALELGYSQARQILLLFGGFFFGPLVMLILYVYLVRKAMEEGKPGAR